MLDNRFGLPKELRLIALFLLAASSISFLLTALPIARALFAEGISAELFDRDIINFWLGAKLAVNGGSDIVFGPWKDYFAVIEKTFGPQLQDRAWSYPPTFLLLIAPFGWLPFKAIFIVWPLATLAVFALGLRLFLPNLRLWHLVLMAPAIAIALDPHTGLLMSGLALAGLGLRERHPLASGFFVALLTAKPHLGLLFPLLLLCERRWSVIGYTMMWIILFVLASIAAFGLEAWQGFVANIVPSQIGWMTIGGGSFLRMMPTLFASLRAFGVDSGTAQIVHYALALPIAVLVLRFVLKETDGRLRAAMVCVATFALSPYLFSYDMPVFSAGLVMVLAVRLERSVPLQGNEVVLFVLAATTPFMAHFHHTAGSAVFVLFPIALTLYMALFLRPAESDRTLMAQPDARIRQALSHAEASD